jgi:putative redox protein
MTTTTHVARAVGATSASAPQWRVELETGSHHLVADEPTKMAGGDTGPTPIGLLLCGLAACTSMTLRMYAVRKGWSLAAIEVNVVFNIAYGQRASIDRTISLPTELTEVQRAHLADVAERTPVTMAIRAGTPIITTVRAVDTPTARQTP